MTRLVVALVGLALIQACWGQDAAGTRDLPAAVNLFMELSTDHYADKPWRKVNLDSIFHPDVDYLGTMPRYEGIQEIKPIVTHGQALFLTSKVGKVIRAKAWVDYDRPNKEAEDALFVRIDYLVVATTLNNTMTVLEKPVMAQQYIILATDADDGKQKVIGIYPSMKDEQFIGAKYFLANFEALSGDTRQEKAAGGDRSALRIGHAQGSFTDSTLCTAGQLCVATTSRRHRSAFANSACRKRLRA